MWVPAYFGFDGNEKADRVAGEALAAISKQPVSLHATSLSPSNNRRTKKKEAGKLENSWEIWPNTNTRTTRSWTPEKIKYCGTNAWPVTQPPINVR